MTFLYYYFFSSNCNSYFIAYYIQHFFNYNSYSKCKYMVLQPLKPESTLKFCDVEDDSFGDYN